MTYRNYASAEKDSSVAMLPLNDILVNKQPQMGNNCGGGYAYMGENLSVIQSPKGEES